MEELTRREKVLRLLLGIGLAAGAILLGILVSPMFIQASREILK